MSKDGYRKYRPRKRIIRISHEEIEEATKDFFKRKGKITYLNPRGKTGIGIAENCPAPADEFLTEDTF